MVNPRKLILYQLSDELLRDNFHVCTRSINVYMQNPSDRFRRYNRNPLGIFVKNRSVKVVAEVDYIDDEFHFMLGLKGARSAANSSLEKFGILRVAKLHANVIPNFRTFLHDKIGSIKVNSTEAYDLLRSAHLLIRANYPQLQFKKNRTVGDGARV